MTKAIELCDENQNHYANTEATLDAGLDYPEFGATYLKLPCAGSGLQPELTFGVFGIEPPQRR